MRRRLQRWIREGGRKEEEETQGFSYSMFIGGCRMQFTLQCIIHVSLSSTVLALFHKPIFLFDSNLFFVSFDPAPPSASFLSSPTSPLPSVFLSFHSSSLFSLIIFRGHAVKPFNGSVGVLEVWWELPWSKSSAETHTALWSSYSLWDRPISFPAQCRTGLSFCPVS